MLIPITIAAFRNLPCMSGHQQRLTSTCTSMIRLCQIFKSCEPQVVSSHSLRLARNWVHYLRELGADNLLVRVFQRRLQNICLPRSDQLHHVVA